MTISKTRAQLRESHVAMCWVSADGETWTPFTGAGAGGTSSTFGSAFPGAGTAIGASDGTNMQPLLVDGSGYLEVNVKAGATGGGALQSATSGGCATYHLVFAATTNAHNIKSSAGQLYAVRINNNTTYPIFVKLFNKATAPTPGTDTPVLTFMCQAGVSRDVVTAVGDVFSSGIGLCVTKVITDADTTAVVLNDGSVDVEYA